MELPSEEKKRDPRHKNWVFTSFELLPPLFLEANMVFLIYQKEKAPDTGALHWQGFVSFVDRFTTMKKAKELLGSDKIHLEPAANVEKSIEYCQKANTRVDGPFIFGDQDKVCKKKGQRTDLLEIQTKLKAGANTKEIADTHFSSWVKYHRAFAVYKSLVQEKRTRPPCILIFWGPSGTGKSECALALSSCKSSYWITPGNGKNVWFDDYSNEEFFVLDDFYGWIKYDYLLRLLDRYPLRVETKGGGGQFTSCHVIFTSNLRWDCWYKVGSHGAALQRRVREFGASFETSKDKNGRSVWFHEQSGTKFGPGEPHTVFYCRCGQFGYNVCTRKSVGGMLQSAKGDSGVNLAAVVPGDIAVARVRDETSSVTDTRSGVILCPDLVASEVSEERLPDEASEEICLEDEVREGKGYLY